MSSASLLWAGLTRVPLSGTDCPCGLCTCSNTLPVSESTLGPARNKIVSTSRVWTPDRTSSSNALSPAFHSCQTLKLTNRFINVYKYRLYRPQVHEHVFSHLQDVLSLADQIVDVPRVDERLVGRDVVSPLHLPVVEYKLGCEGALQTDAVPGLFRVYVAVEAGVHFLEAIDYGEFTVVLCHGLKGNQKFFLLKLNCSFFCIA